MKHRICRFFLLSVAIFLAARLWFPRAMALETEDRFARDYTYTVTNGEATITRYWGDAATLCVPAELDGYPVAAIDNLTFSSCFGLTEVSLPSSCVSLGKMLFYDCKQLRNIDCSTGNPAFVSVGGVLLNADQSVLLAYPPGRRGAYAIPESVVSVGDYAFASCTGLTAVTIPEGMVSIGDYAFWQCVSLSSITIPDGVVSIGSCAFRECDLTSVSLPASCATIGEWAFFGCDSLERIDCRPGNSAFLSIDGVLFTGDGTLLLLYPQGRNGPGAIPEGCIAVNDSAFLNSGATTIIIPSSMPAIDDGAFWGSSITSVIIPDTVTSIGDSAFEECYYLNSVTIPGSVTHIGDGAFRNCDELPALLIPDSVSFIGKDAFSGCGKLILQTAAGSYAARYAATHGIAHTVVP